MKLLGGITAGLLSAVLLFGCTATNDNMSSEDGGISSVITAEPSAEFSDTYYVGVDYGGKGWGEFYDCLSAKLTVCSDKTVRIELPETDGYQVTGFTLADTLTISDENYNNIVNAVDRDKLYALDPEEDKDVCDGNSYYLYLYDKEGAPLKNCGGYMPKNSQFMDMYNAVCDNLPQDDIDRLREDWINKQREKNDSK